MAPYNYPIMADLAVFISGLWVAARITMNVYVGIWAISKAIYRQTFTYTLYPWADGTAFGLFIVSLFVNFRLDYYMGF